ncbi:MAG: ABC transporter permease [Ilumatobacteraceae bacterium]
MQTDWFPVYGEGSGFVDRLHHLILPAIAGTRQHRADGARHASDDDPRTRPDYVVFAPGRGLSRSMTIRYALRNSLVPILTASGLIITSTLVGTVLVEVAFALPGLGTQLVSAVTFKDVPVVQAIALLLTVVIGIVNPSVDAAYALSIHVWHARGPGRERRRRHRGAHVAPPAAGTGGGGLGMGRSRARRRVVRIVDRPRCDVTRPG